MYTHPEIMRAVYQARSDDLHRRTTKVSWSRNRSGVRTAIRRTDPAVRPHDVAMRPALVRTP
jgi:hypothetical protein